ncbi:MAG: glutamate-1-semialdehyde 2,1-aminomutase [Acidimicrobiales bacterium]|nr:glutamate-1-semialdehyde-2,1-aminomutase [Acidimicrobiaceae bacterium]MDP6322489.1 glutamate-1-semialdehyde 2,1-aminomutase [Acidimicrobiales bacterium]MDP6894120.1 glutamate-1-semialdehyde 2,1-aminomutase [Acidimicrobiales bacterium]HJM37778.1 glutamate-1-semialdehyde 2,1-aminomutase [Acidimicrobiales bacterium]
MSDKNQTLFERAKKVIPGGVNSPVRSFNSVGGVPYFVRNAEGPYVWDEEGHRYIDFVQSYGPMILGHSHPAVIEAINKAASCGTSYGAPTEKEIILAETIIDRVKGIESIRFVNSGTEATMTALRLARGVTKRSKIIKFSGCYHGHSDTLLAAAGSGLATQGMSGSDGVTESAVFDTVVVPFNQVPEVDQSIAAVIVEPVAANMGLVEPDSDFLQELRKACDLAGALLVFDEVITGFRLSYGGASSWYGVTPDIWCFGKIIGGGLPVGAFAARQELMSHLAPLGGVYQAGTLSGNPLAMAAGQATLELLGDSEYEYLDAIANRLAEGLKEVASNSNLEISTPKVGPLVGIFFSDKSPSNFDEVKPIAENGLYPDFFHGMLKRGVALAPGPYEILFPSLAHSEKLIDETIEIASDVVKEIELRGS